MFLDPFYQDNQGSILVSAEQASSFAKDIASDYNPIHNADHRRFCVPGDLLFALTLVKYGLSQQMTFTFEGMVGKDIYLQFPAQRSDEFQLKDDKDKQYLNVKSFGNINHEIQTIESFIRSYVAFSGDNFMKVLVPLMTEHQMMINTTRPLVIYESMSFDLEHFNFTQPILQLSGSTMTVKGKRGEVKLNFDIICHDEKVGTGSKTLILSGLRAFNQEQLNVLIAEYDAVSAVV